MRNLVERFWSRVNKDGPIQPHMDTPCWEWTGAINSHGYGSIRGEGPHFPMLGAHRAAWEMKHGRLAVGLQACHRCDNRRCVQVSHMFVGTSAENTADRDAKGRQARQRGEAQGAAKLTWERAEKIRRIYGAGGITQRDLAASEGVTAMAINKIVNNRSWVRLA